MAPRRVYDVATGRRLGALRVTTSALAIHHVDMASLADRLTSVEAITRSAAKVVGDDTFG